MKNENENHQNNTTNEFLGDWGEIVGSTLSFENWSFYENGSAKRNLTEYYENQWTTGISWFDYTIENISADICFVPKNESPGSPNYFSMCFSYRFTNNSTHLSLSSNGIIVIDLVKLS